MKKLFPYILIVFIVVQMLMPFTVGVGVKNNLEVRNNKAEAEFATIIGPNNNGIVLETTVSKTNKSITIDATVIWTQKPAPLTQEGVQITKTDPVSGVATPVELSLSSVDSQADGYHQTGSTTFPNLTPLTTYNIKSEARQINQLTLGTGGLKWSSYQLWDASPENIDPTLNTLFFNVIRVDNVDTSPAGNTTTVKEDKQITRNMDSALPYCNIAEGKTWPGCFGIALYHLIFRPTAFLFAKIGQILDFAVDYSVRDSSYRSGFVVEGWGVVRDFCNMFFIFVLLYIAFGTILNLHSVKTKEMIINVVIIGLLINFSLFATQIIIDTSNILTRVFYSTITVGPKVNGVVQEQRGPFGEIKLSEAIVAKINPQDLIFRASEVNDIPIKGDIGSGIKEPSTGVSAGTFILVTILASIINIVGLITFLSCSLIFISRVVGLWLAMIFAPLAFFSYTVPALQDMEMVGWKKWWPETIKLAFLAPVFVFFMYLIIKFLETGLGLSDTLGIDKSKMDLILGIFVPFIFIMILLTKAKDIAKKMSGTIGQSITNGIAKVGGMALGVAGGVALGGLAMASRATVGRGMNKLATSEWASTHGAIGRGLGNFGKWAGSGSMDIRGVKIAGKGLSDTGLKGLGKATEGGYAKHLSDKVEKRQKRAKELEVHENEPMKQALNKTENDLQGLLVTNAKEIESVDKLIERKRQEASDAERNLKATAPGSQEQTNARATLVLANDEVAEAKKKKKYLREGKDYTEVYGKPEDIGKVRNYSKSALVDGKSIDNLEILQKEQAQEIKTENATRKGEFARRKARFGGRANKEAEHKIIMDAKMDSGTKV